MLVGDVAGKLGCLGVSLSSGCVANCRGAGALGSDCQDDVLFGGEAGPIASEYRRASEEQGCNERQRGQDKARAQFLSRLGLLFGAQAFGLGHLLGGLQLEQALALCGGMNFFLAGAMLLLFGVTRIGGVIRYVPESVVLGFTAGIAIVIWVGQWQNFLGLPAVQGEALYEKLPGLIAALAHVHPATAMLGVASLLVVVFYLRSRRKKSFNRWTLLSAIMLGLTAALFATPGLFAEELTRKTLTRTAAVEEGPFYPPKLPLDTDNDLIIDYDSATPYATIEALREYESSILDVASTEGIDLTVKLNVAHREVGIELDRFFDRLGKNVRVG